MKSISRTTTITVFLTLLIFTFSGTAFSKMYSIKGERVQVRSGAGTKYSVKWEYGNGFPLKRLSTRGKWVKVKDFEGDTGWVHSKFVNSERHMIVKVNKGKKKKINIRSGPSTKYKIVGQAYYGVVFKTLEQKKGWAKVRHESGLTGWVKRSLLWGF